MNQKDFFPTNASKILGKGKGVYSCLKHGGWHKKDGPKCTLKSESSFSSAGAELPKEIASFFKATGNDPNRNDKSYKQF
jgi:hypothetical protein